MFAFQDKVVLITGASSGIGKIAGELFLKQGATVIGTIRRNQDHFTELAKDYSDTCFTEKLEVTNAIQVQQVVDRVQNRFGKIDILVNNAGVHMNGTVLTTKEEEWDTLFASNVKSVFLMCKYALPKMLERKQGVVVNVVSRVGMIGSPNSAAYCASKAAVCNLTREMALDYSSKGIRVVAVAPGMVETPMVDRQFVDRDAQKLQVMENYPMGRFSTAEEVANVVMFLASEMASNLTGLIVPVDGGRSAM